ncbi:MAG: hypothetical protein JST83_14440 [Bacteroidetes bacterium]|nr:hypothetical protein [Bacteroidota bacterium]
MRQRFYIQIIIVLALATCLSSLCYYITCAGLRHSREGEPGKISFILYDTSRYEVLFTGSSRISRNIDAGLFTSKTGHSTYNAGIDGAGFATMAWLTREFIKSHHTPRYIFINIDLYAMEVESGLFYYPMFYPYLHGSDTRALEAADKRLRRGKWLPFCAIADIDDYLKGVSVDALFSGNGSADSIFHRSGYEPIYSSTYTGQEDSMVLTFDYDVSNFARLDSLCAGCSAEGCQLFFLMSPIYNAREMQTDNSRIFYEYLRNIEAKYNIVELNYYTDRRFGHDMFFNRTHLNNKGATVYTGLLADTFTSLTSSKMP